VEWACQCELLNRNLQEGFGARRRRRTGARPPSKNSIPQPDLRCSTLGRRAKVASFVGRRAPSTNSPENFSRRRTHQLVYTAHGNLRIPQCRPPGLGALARAAPRRQTYKGLSDHVSRWKEIAALSGLTRFMPFIVAVSPNNVRIFGTIEDYPRR